MQASEGRLQVVEHAGWVRVHLSDLGLIGAPLVAKLGIETTLAGKLVHRTSPGDSMIFGVDKTESMLTEATFLRSRDRSSSESTPAQMLEQYSQQL